MSELFPSQQPNAKILTMVNSTPTDAFATKLLPPTSSTQEPIYVSLISHRGRPGACTINETIAGTWSSLVHLLTIYVDATLSNHNTFHTIALLLLVVDLVPTHGFPKSLGPLWSLFGPMLSLWGSSYCSAFPRSFAFCNIKIHDIFLLYSSHFPRSQYWLPAGLQHCQPKTTYGRYHHCNYYPCWPSRDHCWVMCVSLYIYLALLLLALPNPANKLESNKQYPEPDSTDGSVEDPYPANVILSLYHSLDKIGHEQRRMDIHGYIRLEGGHRLEPNM